jgi:DNA (cytosine-5)-methyltransferase 1
MALLTIGSLFSGIGGLELGLEGAGLGPTLWQVERDPYCQEVLSKHWPSATRFDDVRGVGTGTLQPVQLICGGFPCQDISVAGKRAGLAGERSGLWREFARIVGELRPPFVLVENVAALLERGALGSVLGDLAALGYDAWWDCLPAAALGAPHQRDRLFLLAYSSAHGDRHAPAADAHADGRPDGDHQALWERCQARAARLCEVLLAQAGHPQSEVGGDAYGFSARVDWPRRPTEPQRRGEPWRTITRPCTYRKKRLSALGNAVSPPVAFAIGCLVRCVAEALRPEALA